MSINEAYVRACVRTYVRIYVRKLLLNRSNTINWYWYSWELSLSFLALHGTEFLLSNWPTEFFLNEICSQHKLMSLNHQAVKFCCNKRISYRDNSKILRHSYYWIIPSFNPKIKITFLWLI